MKRLSYILILCLSGCSLSPVYEQPPLPVKNQFPLANELQEGTLASDLGWQSMFIDPRLQKLIKLALENNKDLRIATLNVEAVRAQYNIQQADRLPHANVGINGSRQRAPDVSSRSGETSIQNQVGVNLGVTAFEMDLFGRVKSLSDAAFARYLSSIEGKRSAQIALVSAVAQAYLTERLEQGQKQLSENTYHDWEQSYRLVLQLKQANQVDAIDVAQAEGQVATAQADLEARKRAVAKAQNALQLLVGTTLPDDLPAGLPLEKQLILAEFAAGLPSDLLYRRPDILQAEQNLIAKNADIGAARAAFFPQISLTGAFGYSSTSMNNLFDSSHHVWSFLPQITVPIFMGGKLQSELRLSEIRKSSAIVEYEKAIQVAFSEVADGLAGVATYGRQLEAQVQVVKSAKQRAELSELRYKAGIDGRLELLDAQRQLYTAQQNLLDLRQQQYGNVISLYKALGGGIVENNITPSQSENK